LASRCVEIVAKSSMRKKTLIGAVGHIRVSTGVKCGGVVVREAKNNLDASSQSMNVKRMMMKKKTQVTRLIKKLNKTNMSGVSVVKN